jgi:phage-related protein (TIGR01555 family)
VNLSGFITALIALVAPAAKPDAKPDMTAPTATMPRIDEEVLANARRRTPTRRGVPPSKLFARALHPPGVVEGDDPKLAMDDNSWTGIDSALQWADQSFSAWGLDDGTRFLGFAVLSELSQRPEYRAVHDIISTEMTRKWIKLQAAGTEDKTAKIKELEAELKRLKIRELFKMLAVQDAQFGRSHLYVDTGDGDNQEELLTPIGSGRDDTTKQKLKKGKLRCFKTIEATWVYPLTYNSTDPLADDWYRPSVWMSMSKRIHRSRLLTFIGREMPDLMKPVYSFGGLSMSQMIRPYVDKFLKTTNSVTDILSAYSVFVLETNLTDQLNAQSGGLQLFKRLDLFNMTRDNKGVMAINKNTEAFQNVSAPLGTLDALQAQSQEHLGSISRIPLIKLLGIQPAGLNASSEGEIETFEDAIHAYQESFYRPGLTTVIDIAQINLWGEVDDAITFEFEKLGNIDMAEAATIRKTEAETATIHIANRAIASEEERKRISSDEDSPYHALDLKEGPVALSAEEQAEVGSKTLTAIAALFSAGLFDKPTGLKEIKNSADITGIGSEITPELITEAENEPPAPTPGMLGQPGGPGGPGGADPGGGPPAPAQKALAGPDKPAADAVLATDPPVSEAQRRAMEAAAHGHSTLGIPKKVGAEFVGDAAPVIRIEVAAAAAAPAKPANDAAPPKLTGANVFVSGQDARLRFVGKDGAAVDMPVVNPELAKMLIDRKNAISDSDDLNPPQAILDLIGGA